VPAPLPLSQARLVALLRLLLLAVSLAAVAGFLSSIAPQVLGESAKLLQWLLISVAVVTGLLLIAVRWVHWSWQIGLQLVFDLLWIGGVIYCTGGPASPAVVLLFAVVLIGNLVLPGLAPFLMPALASLVLSAVGSLYLAGDIPLPRTVTDANPDLINTKRVLVTIALQVVALFLVDLLAQALARRHSEHRVFTGEVLDQLAEGVLAVDRQGLIVYLNAEAIRLLDLHRLAEVPALDLIGRPASAALAGGELAQAADLLSGDRCPAIRRIEAFDRHLVLRVSALTGRGDRPIGRTLLIADETRLRLLEENARRAESLAALGEMAAGIAHEVRNPLTSLRGCAQEISEISERSGDHDARDLAGIMVGEADRIGRIVEDFLTLARQRPPSPQAIDPRALLAAQQALVASRRDLPPGLAVTVDINSGCPSIHADPDQLQQVVTNLVGNALDALHGVPTPRLTLRADPAPDDGPLGPGSVQISISDNGCGIPEDEQERVFAPFYSTKARGTGLGLSLVTRIIREHEGVLHLISSPGNGTTITVHLPSGSMTRQFRRAVGGGSSAVAVLR
jgi:two-component system sensor histidine kinase PilS (NtrC family)